MSLDVSDRLVFEGEADDGIRVRVTWDPADAETVWVFTLTGEHARWSRPVECARTDE